MSSDDFIEAEAEVGDVTIVARADATVIDLIDDVFEVLALEPEELRSGYSSWFGWGPLFLGSEGSTLVVGTPDYGSFPLAGPTNDVTLALQIELDQRRISQALTIEPAVIDFQDPILMQPDLDPHSGLVVSWTAAPDHEEPIRVVHSSEASITDLQAFQETQLWRCRQLIPRVNPLFAVPYGMTCSLTTKGRVELTATNTGSTVWSGQL